MSKVTKVCIDIFSTPPCRFDWNKLDRYLPCLNFPEPDHVLTKELFVNFPKSKIDGRAAAFQIEG